MPHGFIGKFKHGDSDLDFAKALKLWRYALGWTIERTATEVGCSRFILGQIDRGDIIPSIHLIEKFRQSQGIDLYMLAYCQSADTSKLTPKVQAAVHDLKVAWDEAISVYHSVKHKLPSGWW